jgi:hypothetical protein
MGRNVTGVTDIPGLVHGAVPLSAHPAAGCGQHPCIPNMNSGSPRATLPYSVTNDGECTVKKGRHRRYEEARALKRGSDLDIESIFSDLEGERASHPGDFVDDERGGEVDDDLLDDDLIEDEIEHR